MTPRPGPRIRVTACTRGASTDWSALLQPYPRDEPGWEVLIPSRLTQSRRYIAVWYRNWHDAIDHATFAAAIAKRAGRGR